MNGVLADLRSEIDDRSARGIAAAVNRLVSSGRLAVGTRLPTVRELARLLGVSPTTVSEAWQTLAGVGAVEGRGRLGTFVCQPTGPGAPTRYRRVTEGPGHFSLDLSTGTPDRDLLPDLAAAIGLLGERSFTSSYLDPAVLPALEEHLRATWPFSPQAITVVDGAMDALDRLAQQVVRLGDRVVVEQPTFPPLLDLLDHLGAEIVGVPMDAEGMLPGPFAEALALDPAAVICQLRAHNPTGITTSARRAKALAGALARSRATIIEDDHSGDIATGTLVSLGRWLPERTVHIRSFSKSHGPDLRLAAIGGAEGPVRAVANRRLLGAGWTSRILQAVLLTMLTDPVTVQAVRHARDTYAAPARRGVRGARSLRRELHRRRRHQPVGRRRQRACRDAHPRRPRHRRGPRRAVHGRLARPRRSRRPRLGPRHRRPDPRRLPHRRRHRPVHGIVSPPHVALTHPPFMRMIAAFYPIILMKARPVPAVRSLGRCPRSERSTSVTSARSVSTGPASTIRA
ncbi:MAG: aminotransferase class I/II-fold pyridoxal phosphate-dependent enzyme [Ilumatobacteraceae bacterium]